MHAAAAASPRGRELTLRGIALGIAITFVFTAANIYLGLKVGLTFATSIPAAVISMALLRLARGSNIFENNIVQTVASAAGAMGSIIFVLPGLVMMGWWTNGFPFWPSFLLCACGGLLGVLLSIPLRRALVTGSDLPYPEGVAAAEVLRLGSDAGGGASAEAAAENRLGLRAVIAGAIASAAFPALAATRLVGNHVERWFRIGAAPTGVTFDLLFALIGVGHLVGLSVGIAMFAGALFAFGIATPLLGAWGHVAGPAADAAQGVWQHQVRFIGAGVIGIAALWTLIALIAPIWRGLVEAGQASRLRRTSAAAALPIEERDLPVSALGFGTLALALPILLLLFAFARGGPLGGHALPLAIGGLGYVLIVSIIVAAVCGYMAGLIGSSNSPLSGIGILAVVGASLLLALFAAPVAGPAAQPQLVAFALFATAIIFAAATVANDNLQDLKTGQLIGASPARQQIALMIGTVAGSLMVPPVLDLLARAYGFGSGADARATALPAPQATLITALANGVLGAGLDWRLIAAGGTIGAGLIALDHLLGRAGRMRLPPLAVGIGIYLPLSATLAVSLGALIGHIWRRRHPGVVAERTGTLLASGLIVGESLFGVALAALIVASGRDEPLAITGDGWAPAATAIGCALFAATLWALYRWAAKAAARI